ncbi:MAG: InlB B-repeat-containing protein, partial [Paludibacteraceae bacterium]|nr:InlB B-repeat-containing protein [Paludibacteraceae bacterium]
VTLLAMAQIKFIVYKADGSTIELLATEVDSIGFEGNNVQPETPDSPDNPDTPENPDTPNANGHEYVDLGLPSGTLWATMNVGATSAVDYGYYFCWGETTPRTTEYEVSDYKLYEGESFDLNDSDISIFVEGIKKYSKKDKKTVLEYEDDAARANWGGDWRMPTLKELEELVMNCIIDNIQKNGKEYYRFTSIKNNQSIILPMSGAYGWDPQYGPYLAQYGIGEGGLYWSSETYYDSESNFESEFNDNLSYMYNSSMGIGEGTPEEYILGEGDGQPMPRYYAASVRAVLPSKKVHTITFNANGGRGNMSSVDADYAELFTIPTNRFTHAQQDFVCWNTKADGSGKTYMETDKFSVSSDITLYAQWYETYTLKFDGNAGGGYMEDIKVKEKELFKLPKNEFWYWDGEYEYEFAGWNTKPDGSGISYADGQEIFISSNMTLYAQWKEIGSSDNEEGVPNVDNPSEDYTTFLFQIENAACDDFELYLMGIDGAWVDTPEMKFERVPNTTSWFQVTVPAMDETQTNFKIRANGSWTYESKGGYEFYNDAAEYVEDGADGGKIDNLQMIADAGGKVLAFKVIDFISPCAETVSYTVTLKTNYCGPIGTDVAIAGGFPASGWTAIPMEKINNTTYVYTIEGATPGMEFKFDSTEGGWTNEIYVFNEDEYKWKRSGNFTIGDETEIFIDLTDSTYEWYYCISD